LFGWQACEDAQGSAISFSFFLCWLRLDALVEYFMRAVKEGDQVDYQLDIRTVRLYVLSSHYHICREFLGNSAIVINCTRFR
jgi:hypothetical protein